MAEEHRVLLYIYDLSRGVAATMSPILIGNQIVNFHVLRLTWFLF